MAVIVDHYGLLNPLSQVYRVDKGPIKPAVVTAGYTPTVFTGASAGVGAAAAIEAKLAEPSAGAGAGGP
ncbi:MAG: hypothetical protein P1U40_06130 [Coxiellaceae bacterium]|nr:hypothetical protein [Coxiellaceae bacterium]